MGTKSPQILSVNYFFFLGNVAFKINANNPAGIKPVVSNSPNLIPNQAHEQQTQEMRISQFQKIKIKIILKYFFGSFLILKLT